MKTSELFREDEGLTFDDVVLVPATMEDMCGSANVQKPSLEVVYETV